MIEASIVSPEAALGAVVTCTLFLLTALWKLASMLAEVRADTGAIRADTAENREGINRLDNRVTDHRRRSDATILLLREHLDQRIDKLTNGLTVDDAIRSIRHELGTIPDEDHT